MHYILTPFGSSGDVFPYLAIGRELRQRGHDVIVCAAGPFRDAAERAGLAFVSGGSADDYDAITHHPDLWHPRRGMRLVLHLLSEALRDHYATLSDLYEPGRTILVGHPLALVTRTFEEKHRVPAASIHIAPGVIRSEFVAPVFEPGYELSRAPRRYKRGLYWIADRFFLDPHINPSLNAFRAELGLQPVRCVFQDWLHSPQLTIGIFPDWFGPPQPDWPPQIRLTGFILYDETPHIDPEIDEFLADEDTPIVFTPGTGNRQAPGFFDAAVKAVEMLGMARCCSLDTRNSYRPTFLMGCVTRSTFRSPAFCHAPPPSSTTAASAPAPRVLPPAFRNSPCLWASISPTTRRVCAAWASAHGSRRAGSPRRAWRRRSRGCWRVPKPPQLARSMPPWSEQATPWRQLAHCWKS